MKSFIYIVSRKKALSHATATGTDLKLGDKGINANSHWWDGFLITCVESEDKNESKSIISQNRLDINRIAQGVDEYQEFTKNYWEQKDKK
jgi:hypothetical protein